MFYHHALVLVPSNGTENFKSYGSFTVTLLGCTLVCLGTSPGTLRHLTLSHLSVPSPTQAPVVQGVYNAIHQMQYLPSGQLICLPAFFPWDSD